MMAFLTVFFSTYGLNYAYSYIIISPPTNIYQRRVEPFCHGFHLHAVPETASTITKLIPQVSDEHIAQLHTNGFVVIDDFLPKELVTDLRDDIQNLRSEGKFLNAKIGQDSDLDTTYRIAENCFLKRSKFQDIPNIARSTLYDIIDQIRDDLSGNPLLNDGSSDIYPISKTAPVLNPDFTELLYVYYPNGGFYKRHVDGAADSPAEFRTYSLLCYLNQDWKETDEGQLRIYVKKDRLEGGDDEEEEQESFVDVQPKGGTLVLFKSYDMPHEVLNTYSERFAVVGWFNRR